MLAASERRGAAGRGADVDEAYRAMVVHFGLSDRCEEAGAELATVTALCRRGAELRARWESVEFGDHAAAR